ncbi:unnamed protein product [Schistocephalus solidus]|uniref:DUF2958 domain-containing protein n=1 Tax=Schistocephalus solidus TaxID=70667 RepID=A0A183TCA9_SCHSO|nr:unnamed protein product [Schistocephalus solidus]
MRAVTSPPPAPARPPTFLIASVASHAMIPQDATPTRNMIAQYPRPDCSCVGARQAPLGPVPGARVCYCAGKQPVAMSIGQSETATSQLIGFRDDRLRVRASGAATHEVGYGWLMTANKPEMPIPVSLFFASHVILPISLAAAGGARDVYLEDGTITAHLIFGLSREERRWLQSKTTITAILREDGQSAAMPDMSAQSLRPDLAWRRIRVADMPSLTPQPR